MWKFQRRLTHVSIFATVNWLLGGTCWLTLDTCAYPTFVFPSFLPPLVPSLGLSSASFINCELRTSQTASMKCCLYADCIRVFSFSLNAVSGLFALTSYAFWHPQGERLFGVCDELSLKAFNFREEYGGFRWRFRGALLLKRHLL